MTLQPYANEPVIDYSVEENKSKLLKALEQMKSEFGKSYPLWVGGRDVETDNKLESVNPAKKTEVVGYLSQANKSVIDDAFVAANKAFESWSQVSFAERALYLVKAAAVMRRRKEELMACQIYESGKNWAEAD